MNEGGWGDPLGPDDSEAQERERRRRERAERRRDRAQRREARGQGGHEPAQRGGEAERGRERGRELAERALERLRRGREGAKKRSPLAAVRARRPGAGAVKVFGTRRARGLTALLAIGVVLVAGLAVVADFLNGSNEPATPPPELKTISVTIPEGLDRTGIAKVAREAGLRGDYEKATRRSKLLKQVKEYGIEGKPKNLEGFLFPDTYELEKGARVDDLIKRQLEVFEERIGQVDMSFARSKNLSPYDVLIIASMVEREVQVPEERDLASAVIYNRLSSGMTLGIDATIRYALGNFDKPLTESELQADSPYNTRTNPGLPPGPIGNPGLDAIEAAANPADTDYLYYVVKPCAGGKHAFTASESEFFELSRQYEAARQEAGGKSPTNCDGE